MAAMPVLPDLDRPGWRKLVDGDGTPLARFLHVERDGRRIADRFELEVPVERAVPVVFAELGGMRIAGPETLGRALVAGGAVPARHAHVYSHDLRDRPAAPAGLAPLDRPAADLLPSYLAAFGPGHPDRLPRAAAERHLAGVLAGRLGPVLPASGVALAGDAVIGAILIADVAGEPPFGGPWVMELFRDPRAPGAGRALLTRALALTDGPSLGLAVTHGNPAERLYQTLGFRRVFSAFSVDL
jgi:hypothetical protein